MTQDSPWFVAAPHGGDAALRLICFPHAGGGASMYHSWRRLLPPSITIHAAQLPGRENRYSEEPMRTMSEIVVAVADALGAEDARPFVMFGHSMGAVIAFEVARELRRRGREGPSALFLSGRAAPQLGHITAPLSHLEPHEVLLRLADRHGGVPAEVLADGELAEMSGRLVKADMAVLENYVFVAEEALDCTIGAFGGLDDPWVDRGELEAWRDQTRGAFVCEQFPGGHFYFRPPEVLQSLLATIRSTCGGVASGIGSSGDTVTNS